jgi:hypothetical protein
MARNTQRPQGEPAVPEATVRSASSTRLDNKLAGNRTVPKPATQIARHFRVETMQVYPTRGHTHRGHLSKEGISWIAKTLLNRCRWSTDCFSLSSKGCGTRWPGRCRGRTPPGSCPRCAGAGGVRRLHGAVRVSCPRLGRATDALRAEHEGFRTEARRIAQRLEGLSGTDLVALGQVCADLLALLGQVEGHSSKEMALLQEAFEQDEGGGEG